MGRETGGRTQSKGGKRKKRTLFIWNIGEGGKKNLLKRDVAAIAYIFGGKEKDERRVAASLFMREKRRKKKSLF